MMHTSALTAMMNVQADLQKAQEQVSSGKRVTKPSDDPVAAARIMQLQQQQASNTQYGDNISALKTRLSLSDTSLADADSIIQQVSTLAIQANNGSLSDSDKKSIAAQLNQLSQQLMSVANTQDSNGEYLYSGYATTTQPFTRDANGVVTYSGDQGVRQLQIGASQFMDDSTTGQEIFMSAPSGNGTFALSSASTNTGSGVISGTVQNRASWTGGDYTLKFTSATDWEVRDSSNNLVTSGANYKAGNAITFNGVSLSVSGTPAAGDSFTVASSTTKDIFSTIDDLVAALQAPTDTAAQQAQFQNAVNAVSTQLGQSENQVLGARASVGARVSALDTADSARQDAADQLTKSVSTLQDADYAESVSRYSQLYTALQAAQQAYAKTSQLSLFSYL